MLLSAVLTRVVSAFRAIKCAVPLKPKEQGHSIGIILDLPRYQMRGPIEANQSKLLEPWVLLLPRYQMRGPIEAQ